MKSRFIFFPFFIFFLFASLSFGQVRISTKQDVLKTTETLNAQTITYIPIFHGRLVETNETSVRILVDDGNGRVIYEINLSDISLAYKWYNVGDSNEVHRNAAIGALVGAGSGVAVKKISSDNQESFRRTIKNPMVLGGAVAGAGIVYFIEYGLPKLFGSNGKESIGQIPYKTRFYDSSKDGTERLLKIFQGIDKSSYLEIVLK